MSYFDKDEYLNIKNQLRNDYAKSYQKCANYIHSFHNNYLLEEDCMMQILDDFLNAQNEGKPITEITGKNVRRYCDNIMKAELERQTGYNIYRIELVLSSVFLIMVMIFIKTFWFNENNVTLQQLHQLSLNGAEILFLAITLGVILLRRGLSKLFFHQAKLSKYLGVILYILTFGFFSIAFNSDINIAFNLPIPLTLYILITVFSLLGLISCMLISKKNKVNVINDIPEEADEIAKVTCPVCGKQHDFDYPRCPYCKHDYTKIN